VAGYFGSAPSGAITTATFGATVLINEGSLVARGTDDLFVAKLTDAGSTAGFAWAQRGGGANNDLATALAVSGSNVYVAGSYTAPAGFGPTPLTGMGLTDIFVAKLTDAGSTGSFAWAQRAGGSAHDLATALAVSGSRVYVAGTLVSSVATFGAIALTKPSPGGPLGFLASLTDAVGTATAVRPVASTGLYPNPARHQATLRLPAGATPAPLSLTDAQGRVVRRYPGLATSEGVLNLQGLPPGLYFLRGHGLSQRLVVE
jgi:hypothetical protein